MRSVLDIAQPLYWGFTGFATGTIFWVVIAYENPLWELLIPIALVAFGVLTMHRSRYGLASVLAVALLMIIPYYLRTYGGY